MTDRRIMVLAGHNLTTFDKTDIGVVAFSTDGKRRWDGQPVVFTEVDDLEGVCPHTLTLSRDAAQQLMDALYRCGIQPSDEGSPGQLKAIQAHLADMRAITFAKLHVEKP